MNRRNYIKKAFMLTASATLFPESIILANSPSAEKDLQKVKITDVKTASIQLGGYNVELVKVLTDSGLYGLGETYPQTAGAISNINFLKEIVVGKDPLQVELIYNEMLIKAKRSSSYSGAMTGAIAGIETALWDLAGKILETPVYKLLGGKYHDNLLIYHDTSPPEEYLNENAWLEVAASTVEYGFKAIKFDFRHSHATDWNRSSSNKEIESWCRIIEKTKSFLDPDYFFGIDLKYKNNVADSIRIVNEMKDLDLWFIEDPLPPQNISALKKVTDSSDIPIMSGENLYTRHTWRELIESQACDYIHPDTQKCGGLLETKWIADWADMYYIPMACHNLCSPVGTMASAHLCTATKSFFTLESDSIDIPHWADIIVRENDDKFYKDGYLSVSDKPGLGITLNDEICKNHLKPGSNYF